MFSSVQVVLLFDVHCLNRIAFCSNNASKASRLKLSCLRLLTEFGAQTENSEVRWAAKYYDSLVFKSGKANRKFADFNLSSFDNFDSELFEKIKSSDDIRSSQIVHHSHCFILNKAIQEALKDYNWDLPDVNSPVSTRKTRNNINHQENVPLNAIVVFNKLPLDEQDVRNFIGDETSSGRPEAFIQKFLEPATLHELRASQSFSLHFVDLLGRKFDSLSNFSSFTAINEYLDKINGCFHCITSILDLSNLLPTSTSDVLSQIITQQLQGLDNSWFSKSSRCKSSGRVRKSQPGPKLIWEDAQGVNFLKIQLDVMTLQGR